MAQVELMRMLLLVPLMVNFVKTEPLKIDGNDSWQSLYSDLRRGEYSDQEFTEKIDTVLSMLKSTDPGSNKMIKDELTLLQQAARMDIRFCNKEHVKKLVNLGMRYTAKPVKYNANDLKQYLQNKLRNLIEVCRAYEVDKLRVKFSECQATNTFCKMMKLIDDVPKTLVLIDPSKPSTEVSNQNRIIAGIKEYLSGLNDFKKLKSMSKRNFDKLYKEHVLDTCGEWIEATAKLIFWRENYHFLYFMRPSSLTEDEKRWFNYRQLCQTIDLGHIKIEVHKKLVSNK